MPGKASGSVFSTLFSCVFQRKTATTSGAEIETAATARAEKEKAEAAAQLKAATEKKAASAAEPAGTHTYSMTSDAIRKRQARGKSKQQKAKVKAPGKPSCGKSCETHITDTEGETHITDSRGRTRKRKRLRSIAVSARTGKAGQRIFSDTEKQLVVDLFSWMGKRQAFGTVTGAQLAPELQRRHPALFGPGTPGLPKGITRQAVDRIISRISQAGTPDNRGRLPVLPETVVCAIIATFASILAARSTVVSAPMLQPVAIGVIIASGYGSLIKEGQNRRGVFCCGLHFIRGIMRDRGWTCVKPQADTRKLPSDWRSLRWAMVLRLAYFVFVHEIPGCLVINADHTGIMFTQIKGRMWITKEQKDAKDKSVQGHSDKRQFTLLATTSAAGKQVGTPTVRRAVCSRMCVCA